MNYVTKVQQIYRPALFFRIVSSTSGHRECSHRATLVDREQVMTSLFLYTTASSIFLATEAGLAPD